MGQRKRALSTIRALSKIKERLILEGAGACDTALLLDTGAERFEQRFAVIYSGDNIDPDTFLEIVKIH